LQYKGAKCFEVHCIACADAVPAFPRARCGDLDWSQLGPDGKIRDCPVKVVRSLLETKLRLEGKWKPSYQKYKKAELLTKVLKFICNAAKIILSS
jgi:hypothetical protein